MSEKAKRKDMAGKRFGAWLVTEFAYKLPNHRLFWHCVCDCGTRKMVDGNTLRRGKSTNCGCIQRQIIGAAAKRRATHGCNRVGAKSREYAAWQAMKSRCAPNNPQHADYFDRGISVCAEWGSDFTRFLADMGPRPPKHTLDRKDNDKGYSPDNCRWATYSEQANNKRKNVRVEHEGIIKTLGEWCDIYGLPYFKCWHRIKKGWSLAQLLENHKGGLL